MDWFLYDRDPRQERVKDSLNPLMHNVPKLSDTLLLQDF